MPVGYALIGCGGFGRFCLEAVSKMPNVRPVAVADAVAEAARSVGEDFGLDHYADLKTLLARNDVDVVHIATPPGTHHKLALQAIEAGKHILCEKPLACSVADGEDMLAKAADAGVICPVNFVLRYNAVTDAVKRVLESGLLGEVLAGRLTNCAADTPLGPAHWFWDKAVSGGIFIEHGVHFFDLYGYWLGDGEVLDAHAEIRPGTRQEDRVGCTVRHACGAVVSHEHGFTQAGPMDRTDHRLVCELGDLRVDGWIPLSMDLDLLMDDTGPEHLAALLPGAEIRTTAEYSPGEQDMMGRGKPRHVTRRVQAHFCPEADKQAVYARSVATLLADQLAAVADPSRKRIVAEINGLESLKLAERAAVIAK